MSDRLPPIPTPPSQLWRQVRLQYLPVLVFVIGLLAAAIIWTRWVAPPTLVGEAEAVRTELRSAQAGRLEGLRVELLQPVKAGQTLGHVLVNEPRVLAASLAVIRAEIEMMRTTMDPVVGQQRAALDLEQLQLEWMKSRVELAELRGSLHQAESTLTRTAQLHRSKLVTDDEYDLALNARDTLAARVAGQQELITQLEPRLRALSSDQGGVPSATVGLAAAIKHKEEELKLLEAQLGPVPLVAPIDGVITSLTRRTGEMVAAGEPILQITAARTERIVGFVRQPLNLEPKPGMLVEVRTRTFHRQTGTATVAQVSQQLEPILPSLLAAMRLPVSNVPTEFGLRVHISPPTGLTLRPGEQVDVIIRD